MQRQTYKTVGGYMTYLHYIRSKCMIHRTIIFRRRRWSAHTLPKVFPVALYLYKCSLMLTDKWWL